MTKKIILRIVSICLLIPQLILAPSCINKKPPSTTALPSSAIVSLNFPKTKIPYPGNWPEDLFFPEDLILVEGSSGSAAVGERQGWSGKFRCQCTPNEAQRIIVDDLKGKNWSQIENMRLEAGGVVFLVEKDQGEGIIIIDFDPDDDKQSIILATFFP